MTYNNLIQWLLYLCALPAFSQPALSPLQQNVSTALTNYFALDRENIHLHLNKNIYLTNERIWLKGYIVEKKFMPTHQTANIYVSLYDNGGKKIATQLYFAENNIFEGHLNLDDKLPSGKYFLQVYTNFMNNFWEDESSVYEITILNPSDKNYAIPNVNQDEAVAAFFPEGGVFLKGVSNTIGLRIADCNGFGVPVTDAEVLDNMGKIVATVTTDQFGYGRFEIYDASLIQYKLSYSVNNVKKESLLPFPSAFGVAISVNNYFSPEKTVIKLKTNPLTLSESKNASYLLVIQQNDAASYVDIQFDPSATEKTIAIPNDQISSGVNAIYLIENNLKKIAQRLIFKPIPLVPKTLYNIVAKGKDSIMVTGSAALQTGTLSISVLPAANLSAVPVKNIYGGLLIDNYMMHPIKHLDYYLTDFSKKKHYELDNVMLSELPRYQWEKMLGTPPEKKYESDFGLSIKGILNTDESAKDIYKINMSSPALGFNEFTSLNDKKEFVFRNLLAIDSAKIFFLPKNKAGKVLSYRMGYQILDNNHKFNKPFEWRAPVCASAENHIAQFVPFPKVESSILLDSISVVAKKKRLTYKNRMGNMTARGFKITDADAHKFLLPFIGNNGFTVSHKNGSVSISSHVSGSPTQLRSTMRTSRQGNILMTTRTTESRTDEGGPVVFIDDVPVPNYDMLDNYSMGRIDEIYINKHSNDISVYGTNGIIKIYTRWDSKSASPTGSPQMTVKNGFQRYTPFQNPHYDSVRDEGFQKLGTIYWKPIVETDENGTFSFSLPTAYQKSLRVVIEGMAPDGQIISESAILQIP